jgi:hypothetical protein
VRRDDDGRVADQLSRAGPGRGNVGGEAIRAPNTRESRSPAGTCSVSCSVIAIGV